MVPYDVVVRQAIDTGVRLTVPPVLLILAVIFAVPIIAAWFPRAWWSKALCSAHGPTLDAASMTRLGCFRASLGFFLIGVMGLGTSLLVAWLGNRLHGSFDQQWPYLVLMFVYLSVGMMGVGGGLCLLVRAPFRPASHPERIQVAFLKKCIAADGLRRASLWESPDGSILVVEQS